MLPAEVIRRKRDGNELSADEIAFLVAGITDGGLSDAQVKGQGYEQCLPTIDPSLTGNDYLKAVGQCAVTVDSSLQPLLSAVFGS